MTAHLQFSRWAVRYPVRSPSSIFGTKRTISSHTDSSVMPYSCAATYGYILPGVANLAYELVVQRLMHKKTVLTANLTDRTHINATDDPFYRILPDFCAGSGTFSYVLGSVFARGEVG